MLAKDAILPLELGHYRLREQLGGSAYGVIWRASAPHSPREVALKLVNEEQMALALPEQRARWAASADVEIAFLQSLEPWDERHIVRLLDKGWHNGLPVLALELMDGDLAQHLGALKRDGGALPLAQILDWLAQLNQALAKVHQYGWRYLDLKPSNILVDRRLGIVKLADFGTNRALAALHAHSYAGTASWQAPEQFFPDAGGFYATAAQSDYFALGALFYFLVCGGVALRFCAACGQSYRDYATAGAQRLRERFGGAIPAPLLEEEEAQFRARLAPALADPALALLRALLHADPGQRPRHALQISRMLAAIRDASDEVLATPYSLMLGRMRARKGWSCATAA